MRVKDPSKALPEKAKRSKRPTIPHDEDSSDDIAVGFTCQHVSHAISVNHVKKAIAENLWSVCSECLKERRFCDGQPVLPSDIWLCLKCGFQGCGKNSDSQHSLKHFKSWRTELHCIIISLSTWIVWCYECDEKLSTHCNKKVLAQIVDFLQKHVSKTQTNAFSRIIKLCEEKCETGGKKKGRKSSNVTSVKGITNLGNTCFFNAVMQNLAQSYMLTELMNEIKENGTKLTIFPSADSQLDPLMVELSSPGPLTSALFLFLHSMKETEKGPLSPKALFNQLCQKAPRFKSFQQQDSQELLHYLLDAVRTEETKRIQASILKAFNNPTTKTADDETRKKVKAYGREGVKMNFIDRIFIGELTSTVMCEECANISMVKDPFIDISLPIIEERVSKPLFLGRMSKYRSLQETDNDQHIGTVTIENTLQPGATKKLSSSKDKNQLIHGRKHIRKVSSGEDKTVVISQENGNLEMKGDSSVFASIANTESTLTESPTDGSEKEASHSESSVDADSEDSESESASEQTALLRSTSGCYMYANGYFHDPSASEPPTKEIDSGDEGVSEAISKLHLSSTVTGDRDFGQENEPLNLPNLCFSEEKHMSHSPQNAFQTLSQSYITTSKECSVQSCLYQFTSMELLMGNNKLLCENCTEKKQKYQRETSSTEKKTEGAYTNARKQLLISAVPTILILHLKRFHQAGLSLRKVNRHVDFPLMLDLAPFCSATCKNVNAGEKVLYGLYGIVEHSGSMRGGHYTAYVKVRTPSRKLLEHITGKKNVPGLKEPDSESAGQWVHVSDTYVQVVPESRALSAQAYLLFYERVF
ncbi:ubiquitin carboxyl-terminal hydrolase 45 isoform X1 [Rousettus aegyptiacus]|uniref:Ubiquitin carboxyl-terminal hydrolase n=3 Tax=Rousettus aegyptiacus TaxID=9407 RepID=A0A7J8KJI4_ROUAE|nr:ubiquitin carboxyl-terminal hydrolase 45 isoform X1 [Rousettus aegyptiacus]XP_016007481.2 ubiquitin carboxyl-terminal hydrolase 45 isoform X1 [Rousettus aegyptiacus]XP_016007483.2 ubiquitin carboxyl-terminal hydrolase 45 isoform X1 [Rousettus aegyptiacus]KAF6508972.1 ubiquitin specific peptidase 45 [Rousettus aegyptiacus]